MKLSRALGVSALLAAASCSHANPFDPFASDDLSKYDSYSDGGGAHWVVANGRLEGVGPSLQAVLIRKGVSFADGWAEAESSRADDAGLVLRFYDPNDYYELAFRDDAAPVPRGQLNLAMYHHALGEYREMWNEDVYWARGTRHTVRFEAKGDSLKAYFDGEVRGAVAVSPHTDLEPRTDAGGVGVRQYGGDSTWISTFDVFRWHGAK